MKLTITWLEQKTAKSGKKFAIATLKNESGAEFENTTIFDNFPDFVNLRPDSVIEGDVVTNDYNNKKGWKLVSTARPTRSPSNIAKAMETKATNIAQAQENKAEAVKIASTARDATLLTVALAQGKTEMTNDILQGMWLEFRGWLWQNWDVSDSTYPPFK